MNTIVYIHNAMQALRNFSFKGIEDYAARALTNTGGIAVIPTGLAEIGDMVSYYNSVGMGVDGVWEVPANDQGDLYPALVEDMHASALREYVRKGYAIEFFNTRAGMEEDLIELIGLDWNASVVSIPSSLADIGNDKACVRILAKHLGLNDLFPPHRIISNMKALESAFHAIVSEYGAAVIKPPSWASGLGMAFGSSAETINQFYAGYSGPLENVIVERSLGADHSSMTIVKRFIEGVEVDSWVTTQDCLLNDGVVSHVGSILGDIPTITDNDRAWMQAATAPMYQHFLMCHPRLTGIINWDCIKSQSGERFILEGNFRVTFSTYIREIQRSLAVRHFRERSEPTCCMQKVFPHESISSFADLRRVLGDTLLNSQASVGVIPIVVPCLPRSGYCYLVAVGVDYTQSIDVLRAACRALQIPVRKGYSLTGTLTGES